MLKGNFFLTLGNIRQANSKNTLIFWDRLARIILTVKFMWRKCEQNRRNTAAFYLLLFTSFPIFIDVNIVDIKPLPVVDIINTVSPSGIHLSQLCPWRSSLDEVLN